MVIGIITYFFLIKFKNSYFLLQKLEKVILYKTNFFTKKILFLVLKKYMVIKLKQIMQKLCDKR